MRWFAFFCCVCLAVLGCTQAKDETPKGAGRKGVDWPRFLGPTADSVSPEKGILSPWPRDGLRVVWHRPVAEGYAPPTVAGGRLYLFERQGNTALLHSLNSTTGEPVWKFSYPTEYTDRYSYSGGPRCCPVVDEDRVYIYGPEGMLHCVNTGDGKLVWKVDTKKEYGVVQNFFGVGSAPVIEGDLLIAQVGGSPKGSDEVDFAKVKGNGTGVVAFDKRTGKEKWRLSDELASYSVPVLATIDKRRWCFVFARGGLIGLDPASGKQDFYFPWRARAYESVNASNPVVVGDRVLISETYGPGSALLQVKPGGYKVLWTDKARGRDKSMQCHWMTPIHHDGYLYGCSGRHEDADLRCIELATGKVMWTKEELTRTSLLMVDGHFLCLGENGVLRLLKVNPKAYEEVSRMVVLPPGKDGKPDREALPLLRYPCWSAPVLAHGLLYIRPGKGHLVCLELIPAKK
jgi:outer membrane protein assembly factor BamB